MVTVEDVLKEKMKELEDNKIPDLYGYYKSNVEIQLMKNTTIKLIVKYNLKKQEV